MTTITLTCSWCHEENEVRRGVITKVFCWSCAHRADVPRVECDCRKCRMQDVPQAPAKVRAAA